MRARVRSVARSLARSFRSRCARFALTCDIGQNAHGCTCTSGRTRTLHKYTNALTNTSTHTHVYINTHTLSHTHKQTLAHGEYLSFKQAHLKQAERKSAPAHVNVKAREKSSSSLVSTKNMNYNNCSSQFCTHKQTRTCKWIDQHGHREGGTQTNPF